VCNYRLAKSFLPDDPNHHTDKSLSGSRDPYWLEHYHWHRRRASACHVGGGGTSMPVTALTISSKPESRCE